MNPSDTHIRVAARLLQAARTELEGVFRDQTAGYLDQIAPAHVAAEHLDKAIADLAEVVAESDAALARHDPRSLTAWVDRGVEFIDLTPPSAS